jgi:hypothetical protein
MQSNVGSFFSKQCAILAIGVLSLFSIGDYKVNDTKSIYFVYLVDECGYISSLKASYNVRCQINWNIFYSPFICPPTIKMDIFYLYEYSSGGHGCILFRNFKS